MIRFCALSARAKISTARTTVPVGAAVLKDESVIVPETVASHATLGRSGVPATGRDGGGVVAYVNDVARQGYAAEPDADRDGDLRPWRDRAREHIGSGARGVRRACVQDQQQSERSHASFYRHRNDPHVKAQGIRPASHCAILRASPMSQALSLFTSQRSA